MPIGSAGTFGNRARRAAPLLFWFPAVLGAAYLVLFAVRFSGLIERVYWDSDAATAAVIAETAGTGTTVVYRFGWFTALWFALLTKPLPLHRHIWEVAPYVFSLCSVALLARASWRLAGRWAAAMTASAALATSPFVSYGLVTLNFHTGTWLPAVILAVFCLWLIRSPPRPRTVLIAALVSELAGATLASDTLFLVVGVIPFIVVGLLFLWPLRMRYEGWIVLASGLVALPLAVVTTWTMALADVDVHKRAATQFAGEGGLFPNVGHWLKQVVQLANGDYFLDAQVGVRSLLSLGCAIFMLAALAAPFVLLRRELRSPAPSAPRLVYGAFWSTSVLLISAAYVLSIEGEHGGFYLIPILYATAGTAPIVMSGSTARRAIVSLGVGAIAAASLVNLADTKTTIPTPTRPAEGLAGLPPIAAVADQVVEVAKKEGAPYGYADYWDASSLTWNSELAVRVQPVSQCYLPGARTLCAYPFNVNSSWFSARSPRSFVLRNSGSSGLQDEPPDDLGPPSAVHRIDDAFTMYVYPYDIASRLDYSYAPWREDS
jgi:hypothetical protein